MQVNCTDFKVIILINLTQKIHWITANPRAHPQWNNLSILCSHQVMPAFALTLQLACLCFSQLGQLPKDRDKGVLGQRAGLCALGCEREEQTASLTAALSLGWPHMCDWATDPLSAPGEEKGRLVPAIKSGKEGKALIPSSGDVYSVSYLASALSLVTLLFAALTYKKEKLHDWFCFGGVLVDWARQEAGEKIVVGHLTIVILVWSG